MTAQESAENSVITTKGQRRKRYESLVRDYYHDIFRYACWLTRHRPLAEDLTQETFMRAWRAFDSLQSPDCSQGLVVYDFATRKRAPV